ncbi:MAG: exosortase family protein XrtF [Cyclobacteriaceae bacterium]|nr:exosortase family protein XrtF [Cyclobacteriaceae bacterium]
MKNNSSIKEFWPALRFVLIFAGVYFIGNILYGLYIEYYYPLADPMTIWVTHQVVFIVNLFGESASSVVSESEPIVYFRKLDEATGMSKTVLRVFEGCNGLNVVIVFIAFIVAFGGNVKRVMIFIASGCLILHFFNLLRIILLYYTALNRPHFFYYFHKYIFTAFLYLVVFGLWILWTRMKSKQDAAIS